MRKLNNKGLTLIELIVSIALISVVMIFLYRLLANINYESDNEFFASQNQEQRIEITDYIETLIRKIVINDVQISHTSNSASIRIASTTKTYYVNVYKTYINVVDQTAGKTLRSWNIKPGLYSFTKTDCNWIIPSSGATASYYPFVCTIPVYTNNDDNNANNNNTIDDIMISFISTKPGRRS